MDFYNAEKPSMIDSRERNSADGSLVQKARRQVEIFQSQENSGRSFQVVRASQWSSSRATDCGFDIPISNKPSNTRFDDGPSNGSASLLSPRLNLWRSSLSNGASDLDQLSCLCRKLHNEALNTTNQLWSLRSPSPLSPLEAPSAASPTFRAIETGLDSGLEDRVSSNGSFGERRSNSTEDVSSLLNVDDTFARDCKTRRSLQIANSENGRVGYSQSGDGERARRSRQEFIAERARRFEQGVGKANEATTKKNFISAKTFAPIANNDFVKNDPNHPSKFNQVAKISIQDNGQNGQTSPLLSRRFSPAAARKANNKTVVHLRNVASPTSVEPPRCINVTAIKLENDSEPAPNNENGLYGMLMDTSSAPKEEAAAQVAGNGSKPVKKVEFCKTEIHFAADSGKVNIVETDGKPPPTNKFRRRRRKDSLAAAAPANSNNPHHQKSNMPLVHFGDTSYEKYIFGGQGKPPQEMNNKQTALLENPTIEEPAAKIYDPADLELKKERWNSQEKSRENGVGKDKQDRPASYDEAVMQENGAGKHRGTHRTTVNFLNDESSAAAVPKVLEDKPGNSFPSTNHVVHKEIGSLSKRSAPMRQTGSQSEDTDKNQVLLKIVTTHKPMLARVENDHSPANKPRLKPLDSQEESHSPEEQRRGSPSVLASTDLETKDNCDNSNGADESDCDEAPTYENIFDAVSNGDPVYENFQAIKSEPVAKVPIDKVIALKKRPSSSQSEKSISSSYDRRRKKPSSKLGNGSNAELSSEKASRIKTERAKTPIPTKSENNTLRSVSDDRSKSSSRLSGSRDNSIKRYKDATKPTKDDTARGTQAKRKNSPKVVGSLVQEHKATPVINAEKNDGSVRSKKPVEVVYQTAVFNMKNEKLSKPSKGKDIKGPRLINDLICGSKLRRPSDSKKVIKTAIVSQNTSKRKEMPTTMNRQ